MFLNFNYILLFPFNSLEVIKSTMLVVNPQTKLVLTLTSEIHFTADFGVAGKKQKLSVNHYSRKTLVWEQAELNYAYTGAHLDNAVCFG